MTAEQLRAMREANLFRLFIIHLAGWGDSPCSPSGLCFSVSGWRTIIVYRSDESFSVVDLLLVTELEV
jgi:hypothetical protein